MQKNSIKNLLIGADIELFLANKKTKEFVSAEGLIQGTKYEPFFFVPGDKFFATSLDNVLAEFSIPPAKSRLEFLNYTKKAVDYINGAIPKELCTVAFPAANFDHKYLMTEQALTFGCEPDFNAYTGMENSSPHSEDNTLRSAGGHIHFGYDNSEQETNMEIIKAADLFIGVPSVIQEPENKRKELYGKAGAFRHKSYGVEYRTISNYYLKDKKSTLWVYDAAKAAIKFLNDGNYIEDTFGKIVQDTINTGNKENALALIKDFNLKMAI